MEDRGDQLEKPWTRQQVKYLLSDVSPLTATQKEKMKQELHQNPQLGHKPAPKHTGRKS